MESKAGFFSWPNLACSIFHLLQPAETILHGGVGPLAAALAPTSVLMGRG